jgi:hypothetical protein
MKSYKHGYLLNLIGTKDDSLDLYYDRAVRVSRFAVQIRYPDQVIRLTKEQIRDAIELANLIFELVQSKITSIAH